MNALHKLIHAIPINYTRSAISAQTLSIKTLMKHSCHLGSYFMHQSNIQTTFGRRSNLNIINLTHTLSSLRRAASITKDIAARDGVILFVGPKLTHSMIVQAAINSKQYYTLDWKSGTLTNAKNILGKNQPQMLPDLLVVLNVKSSMEAVREATIMNIPVVGVVDTDADAGSVLYPVFCNDDSIESLAVVIGVLERAAKDGLDTMNI